MSEWFKEHAWKACVGETLPRVRIPLSPPPSVAALRRSRLEWSSGIARLAQQLAALGANPSLSATFRRCAPSVAARVVFRHRAARSTARRAWRESLSLRHLPSLRSVGRGSSGLQASRGSLNSSPRLARIPLSPPPSVAALRRSRLEWSSGIARLAQQLAALGANPSLSATFRRCAPSVAARVVFRHRAARSTARRAWRESLSLRHLPSLRSVGRGSSGLQASRGSLNSSPRLARIPLSPPPSVAALRRSRLEWS